jgi:hypothetical protein
MHMHRRCMTLVPLCRATHQVCCCLQAWDFVLPTCACCSSSCTTNDPRRQVCIHRCLFVCVLLFFLSRHAACVPNPISNSCCSGVTGAACAVCQTIQDPLLRCHNLALISCMCAGLSWTRALVHASSVLHDCRAHSSLPPTTYLWLCSVAATGGNAVGHLHRCIWFCGLLFGDGRNRALP